MCEFGRLCSRRLQQSILQVIKALTNDSETGQLKYFLILHMQ